MKPILVCVLLFLAVSSVKASEKFSSKTKSPSKINRISMLGYHYPHIQVDLIRNNICLDSRIDGCTICQVVAGALIDFFSINGVDKILEEDLDKICEALPNSIQAQVGL